MTRNSLTADEVFFAALERRGAERQAFLAQACAGNAALYAEVLSLLEAHRHAGDFLQRPAAASASTGLRLAAPPPWKAEDWVGRRIGPYRALRLLGTGGMGAVLLAERADEQFRKRVAIKLIRAGMATEEVLRRFRRERQVLAQLDHPNIARLIDGGPTDDGLPYLVMDYVDGLPIDRFCEQHQLGLADRLRLFQKVCAAVEHAHQRLVIHRDLKPGNILISADGEPKLLDFGIAKVLEAAPDTGLETTAPTQRLLTPRYASPEHLRGQPVSTTSDVYSLGVVLYELLTGKSPFAAGSDRLLSIEHAATAEEPTPPSAIVLAKRRAGDRNGPAAAHGGDLPAGAMGQDTRRLSRGLSGDLDNIILKALRKEPHRRYASVEALSQDIRRHLEGLPVSARPDTLRYRLAKFLRRNAIAAGWAALLGLGLLLAAIISTSMYFQAEAARREAVQQRAAADHVGLFLKEMLASIDPSYARGRDTSVIRQVVHDAAARIDAELAQLPQVAAELHLTLGNVYSAIAEYDQAERHLRRSLELRRTSSAVDPLTTADSAIALARLLRDRSRYEEAEPLFRESLRIRQAALGPRHPKVANALVSLGIHLEHIGKYDEAEASYRRALDIQEHAAEMDEIAISQTLGNLGVYLMYQNRQAEAREPLQRAVAMRRATVEPGHLSLAEPLRHLAAWHRRDRRYEQAETLLLEVLEIGRTHLPPDHPELLNTLANLAAVYQDMGDYDAAEPMYRETLALERRAHGDLHKDTATTANNLASLLRITGNKQEAAALFAEATDVYRQVLGADHYWTSIAANNHGATLVELGRFSEADPLLREALRIRRLHDAPDWQIAEVEVWIGACLTEQGAFAAAEAMLQRARAALEPRRPPSRSLRYAFDHLADLYDRWNRPDQAADYRARADAHRL